MHYEGYLSDSALGSRVRGYSIRSGVGRPDQGGCGFQT